MQLMFSSQPFLPRFSHMEFMVTPSSQLGVVLDAFWWLGQICILKILLWSLEGVEGGEKLECILALGPGRDERRWPTLELGWRLRAVSIVKRCLGRWTSQPAFGWATEVLEYEGQGWHAQINDCLAALLEKLQFLIIIVFYKLQSVWTQSVSFSASNPAGGLDTFSILWLKKSKLRAVEFKVAQVQLVTERGILSSCRDPTDLIWLI